MLYTVKDNQCVSLFYLQYIGNDPEEFNDPFIKKIILYKGGEGSKTDIKIKEMVIDSTGFDDTGFWKSNYKELIKNK